MRIRSIKPEFWRSEDIDALTIEDRFLFIGLWSYVDDNGVGRDKLSDIAADLFAGDLERDPSETFARVSRGLQNLSDAGRITRYTVSGKAYLHVTNWDKHQRIDKPNKPRFPVPTCEDALIRDTLATPSRDSSDIPAPGTGEQGNRGTVLSSASADAEREFDEWYALYPRKRDRGHAFKAYKTARKKAAAQTLLDALDAQCSELVKKGVEFAPYPATWLTGERWLDQQDEQTAVANGFPRNGTAAEKDAWVAAQPRAADGAWYGGSR